MSFKLELRATPDDCSSCHSNSRTYDVNNKLGAVGSVSIPCLAVTCARVLIYNGSYAVKHMSQLNLTLNVEAISIGENITLTGFITPPAQNLSITLIYTSINGTFQQTVFTSSNGTFTGSFKPSTEGKWSFEAMFEGNSMFCRSSSVFLMFKVEPPSFISQYSTYIFAGVGIAGVAVFYVKKRRA